VHFRYPYLGSLKPDILELSDAMLSDHPIMWAECGTLFVEGPFERVRRYLDTDYFTITEINV